LNRDQTPLWLVETVFLESISWRSMGERNLVPTALENVPIHGRRKRTAGLLLQSLCLLCIVTIPAHGLGAGDAGSAGSDILVAAGMITDAQRSRLKMQNCGFSSMGKKIELKEEITSLKGGRHEAELSC
jgi:hypothetical protein